MGLVEATVPKKWKVKFISAVAARRAVNAKRREGRPPTAAETNRDYRCMAALPLWLQPIADKRAK